MPIVSTRIDRKTESPQAAADALPWWRGAVIYQIYPRSFMDANGDGVGDLPGILSRLDYVASLGVDAIWLSPFFTSPMHDYGYDVSDYRDVDPIFGTLADFDAIVEKAHMLGIKVIIDQVYSHTSDAHAWFTQSRQDRTNDKAEWYVWADPKEDGTPPNNWLSVFGGSAWAWCNHRRQYYLHNFLTQQPDLNVHNEAVQDALLDVAKFWLDRGVDGFRLDAINFAMHDPLLRDNPLAPRDGRAFRQPLDYQSAVFSRSHPNITKFLERIRTLTDQYDDVFTVAEVGGETPLAEMKSFTDDDRRLNSAYGFDFLYAASLTPKILRSALESWPGAASEGWPSWAFSNHDAPRAISRWSPNDTGARAAKLYAMLLMALRGNVFLYQGEELGLPQAELCFEDLKDPEAIANWPLTLGRDGARTPMPWDSKQPNAGFSTGDTWLPVSRDHVSRAMTVQEADAGSTLNFIRKLIELRKTSSALRTGDLRFLDAPLELIVFERKSDSEKMICVFNVSEQAAAVPSSLAGASIITSVGLDADTPTPPNQLEPMSGFLARATR